MKYIH